MASIIHFNFIRLSAVSDIFEHFILAEHTRDFVCFSCSALEWIKSYLSERSFQDLQPNDILNSTQLNYYVLQWSILGPILFHNYHFLFFFLSFKLGIFYHCCAEETQIFELNINSILNINISHLFPRTQIYKIKNLVTFLNFNPIYGMLNLLINKCFLDFSQFLKD